MNPLPPIFEPRTQVKCLKDICLIFTEAPRRSVLSLPLQTVPCPGYPAPWVILQSQDANPDLTTEPGVKPQGE